LLGDQLLSLPGASESRSYIVMEEIKESLSLEVPEGDALSGGLV
jgi:Lrp/AsnC family transcriptional regulator, leucine-responsive regulatory protein